MTCYAYDSARTALVSIEDVGDVPTATDLVVSTDPIDADAAGPLARELTELSQAIWAVYDRPTGAGVGDAQEEFRTDSDLEALDQAAAMVLDPRRPEHGYLVQSYTPIDERANRVGRALDPLPMPWRQVVSDEVAAEADAVRRADLGDFSGRAAQAVWRDRPEVNPALLDSGLGLIMDDPDAVATLPPKVGIMAADAGTLVVTYAAALAAAGQVDGDPTQVFIESDNIEACSVLVPTRAVEALEDGLPPETVVATLVSDALAVRAGTIPDLDELLARLDVADHDAAPFEADGDASARRLFRDAAARLTELDTARPAADLWEHLLDGIRSARVLFRESLNDLLDTYPDEDALEPEAFSVAEETWRQRFAEAEATAWARALRAELASIVDDLRR